MHRLAYVLRIYNMQLVLRCLLLFSILFCDAYAQKRGVIVEPGKKNTDSGNTYGLIIGISAYQNPVIASLRYADIDARHFYNYLLEQGADSSNIVLLLNEQAKCGDIWSHLDQINETLKSGDRFYFYFSGHGDIESKMIVPDAFLLAHDAPKGFYASGGTVGISYLKSFLATLSSKGIQVIFIVDACKAGTLIGGREGMDITANVLKEKWKQEIKILSCQAGELSLEGNQWGNGRGLFSYELIEALTGKADLNKDQLVTARELHLYLSKEVPEKALPSAQHPVVEGDLEFVLGKVVQGKSSSVSTATINYNNNLAQKEPLSFIHLYQEYNQYLDSNILVKYDSTGKLLPSALFCLRHFPDSKDAASLYQIMQKQLSAAMINNLTLYTQHYLSRATRQADLPESYYRNADKQTLLSLELMLQEFPGRAKLAELGMLSNVFFAKADAVIFKDITLAMTLTDSAITINPENPLPLFFKANYLAGSSQKADPDAEYAIKRLMELAPQSWLGYSSYAYYRIFRAQPISFPVSALKLKAADKMEILGLIDLAQQIDPINQHIKLDRKYLNDLIDNQTYRLALIDTTTHDYFSRYQTFWYHYYKKEYAKAVVYGEQATRLNPADALCLYNLAAACSQAMLYDKSLEYLDKAATLNPSIAADCVNDLDFLYLRGKPDFKKWYNEKYPSPQN